MCLLDFEPCNRDESDNLSAMDTFYGVNSLQFEITNKSSLSEIIVGFQKEEMFLRNRFHFLCITGQVQESKQQFLNPTQVCVSTFHKITVVS